MNSSGRAPARALGARVEPAPAPRRGLAEVHARVPDAAPSQRQQAALGLAAHARKLRVQQPHAARDAAYGVVGRHERYWWKRRFRGGRRGAENSAAASVAAVCGAAASIAAVCSATAIATATRAGRRRRRVEVVVRDREQACDGQLVRVDEKAPLAEQHERRAAVVRRGQRRARVLAKAREVVERLCVGVGAEAAEAGEGKGRRGARGTSGAGGARGARRGGDARGQAPPP